MNKLTLSVGKIKRKYLDNRVSKFYEVQPYIDGHKLLNNNNNIGLDPQTFLSRNELLQDGELLMGICACGYEGCDDFLVEQRIKDGVVQWTVNRYEYENRTYRFDLQQYKNAVKHLGREAVRSYEKTAENIAYYLLKNTYSRPGYEFMKAEASVENKVITVFYGKGEESLPYVIKWNGKYEYGENRSYFEGEVLKEVDETGDARSNINDFIDKVILGDEDYLLTKAYYENYSNLFHIFADKDDEEPILYNRLKTALLCGSREEMIVALYYATDYFDALVTKLSWLGVSENVIEAVGCFDEAFWMDNPLAQKVVSAIVSVAGKVPNVVLEAFDWIRENGDLDNLKHSVCVALNCDTVEQRVAALLCCNVSCCSDLRLEELRRELDLNEAVLSALRCLCRSKNESEAAWIQRIAANPIARKVKIEELKDSRYSGWRDDNEWKMLRLLCKYER